MTATQTVILRRPEVEKRTGIPRATLYEMIGEGAFPTPVQLGARRLVGWVEAEVEAWLQEQISKPREAAPCRVERRAA